MTLKIQRYEHGEDRPNNFRFMWVCTETEYNSVLMDLFVKHGDEEWSWHDGWNATDTLCQHVKDSRLEAVLSALWDSSTGIINI